MKIFKKKPCNEAICILDYVSNKMKGSKSTLPRPKYSIHKKLLGYFEKLFQNEKHLSKVSKQTLEVAVSLSEFEVLMKHSADKLINFSEDLSTLSESNLAIVEETTASMNEVNDTISNVSGTLTNLTNDSNNLITSNEKGIKDLENVIQIKETVLNDAKQMKIEVDHLIELTQKIDDIVVSVSQIADQTNLLALNASIEAARAGESGKGFAVVADEIKTLAENTKSNLDGMNNFVSDIRNSATRGNKSMENTIHSTTEMSHRIDDVSKTIKDNVGNLHQSVSSIQNVSQSIQEINTSADEINEAMDSSSVDAEKLSEMTKIIHSDSLKSKEIANRFAEVDQLLASINKESVLTLKGTNNSLTNNDLIEIIKQAKTSHINWLKKLENMVINETIEPIQTDGHKCKFGHYYHSINIDYPKIKDSWVNIDSIHENLHKKGKDVMTAITNNDIISAKKSFTMCQNYGKEVLKILDDIILKIEKASSMDIQVYGS